MTKYKLSYEMTTIFSCIVEAPSREDAFKLADKIIYEGEMEEEHTDPTEMIAEEVQP